MSCLPPTLDAKGLAALLYRAESTILRDVSRRAETLPPFIRQGKKPIWITSVVVHWMLARSSEPIDVDPISIFSARVVATPAGAGQSLAQMMMSARKT